MMRTCTKCGGAKPPDGFYGRYPRCKECVKQEQRDYRAANRERLRAWHREHSKKPEAQPARERATKKYRKSPKYKAVRKRRDARVRERNPEKVLARAAVGHALRTGRLVRPDHCASCGAACKPEAHHHHGYEKEHRLDVEWLCKTCHVAAEKAIAAAVRRVNPTRRTTCLATLLKAGAS